jgi:hypothetical protein
MTNDHYVRHLSENCYKPMIRGGATQNIAPLLTIGFYPHAGLDP